MTTDDMDRYEASIEASGFTPDDTLEPKPRRFGTHFPDESQRGPNRVRFIDRRNRILLGTHAPSHY